MPDLRFDSNCPSKTSPVIGRRRASNEIYWFPWEEGRCHNTPRRLTVANLDHPETLPSVFVPLAAILVAVPRRVDSVPVPLARGVALAPVLPPLPAPRRRVVPAPPVDRRVRRERATHHLLTSLHELLLEDLVDPSLRHVVAEVRHVRVAPARGEGAPSRRAGDDRDRYALPLPRRVAPDGRALLAVVLVAAGAGVPEGPLRRRHGTAGGRQRFDVTKRRAPQSAVGH